MATLKWRHLKLSVKELACHFCPFCQPVSLKLQERAYWLHLTKAAEAISAGTWHHYAEACGWSQREIMCLLVVVSSKPPTGGKNIAAVPILHLAICKSR
jgi:hypothetical protein